MLPTGADVETHDRRVKQDSLALADFPQLGGQSGKSEDAGSHAPGRAGKPLHPAVAYEVRREVAVAYEVRREVAVAYEVRREVAVACEVRRDVAVAYEVRREVEVAYEVGRGVAGLRYGLLDWSSRVVGLTADDELGVGNEPQSMDQELDELELSKRWN
jgi:hypothetical protein